MTRESSAPVKRLRNISDAAALYEYHLRNNPDTLRELKGITTREALYDHISKAPSRHSVLQTFAIRIEGMTEALSGVIDVMCEAQLAPGAGGLEWRYMTWGSIALGLSELKRKKADNCRILELLEELTTMNALPVPPVTWTASEEPVLSAILLQLYMELSCGLLTIALFLQKYPQELQVHSKQFQELADEHKSTVLRLRSCVNRLKDGQSQRNGQGGRVDQKTLNIPVHISKHFLGRESDLQTMHRLLSSTQGRPAVLLLHGLPGIGKTQLAARYCKEHNTKYQAVLWVEADTETKILDSYSKSAVQLGLEGTDPNGKSFANVQILMQWLRNRRILNSTEYPWLIAFDNVDNPRTLQKLWPSCDNGHIIITSRSPYYAESYTSFSIQVSPLNAQQSRNLFYELVGEEKLAQHSSQIENILNEWSGVPLALAHMGGYIRRKQLDLPEFLKIYNQDAGRIHQVENVYDEYSYSVATAFSIQALDPNAKAMLQAMCCFDPSRIPNELLLSSIEDDSPIFDSINSIFDYYECIESLCETALIAKNGDDISIHRFSQFVTFTDMTVAERQRAFHAVLSLLESRFPRETRGRPMWKDWKRCDRYLPHVLFLCQRYEECFSKGYKCAKLASLLSACTWYMFERGLFDQAEPLLTLAQAAFSKDDVNSLTEATLLFNLAGIRFECNRVTEARELCFRALQIREALLPPVDPILGNTYYSMGIVYMEDDQLDKALEYNLKAIQVREHCSTQDDEPTAFSYGNLGLCYTKMGRLEEAERYLLQAEHIWRKTCGTKSDKYAQCAYYLGNLYLAKDWIAEAVNYHEQSLNIYKSISPDHHKTGLGYHKIATLDYRQGKYDEALTNLHRALTILDKSFDPLPRVARSLFFMSIVLEDLGRLDEAAEKRKEAEMMRKEIKTIPYVEDTEGLTAFDRLVPSFLA